MSNIRRLPISEAQLEKMIIHKGKSLVGAYCALVMASSFLRDELKRHMELDTFNVASFLRRTFVAQLCAANAMRPLLPDTPASTTLTAHQMLDDLNTWLEATHPKDYEQMGDPP